MFTCALFFTVWCLLSGSSPPASVAHPSALDTSVGAEAGPGCQDSHSIMQGLGATHLPTDPCLCRWGSGEDAPRAAMGPCATWLTSSAKPQPSAFQQKKMFFKNWIWLGWMRHLLSLVDIKGTCCIWKCTLFWNLLWKQWSLFSSLIFRLGHATQCWFFWLCS